MTSLEIFNGIIDYIEENLTGEIDVGFLARKAGLSIYEFRRIFSFLTGVGVNEYIRRRRMSVAAERLMSGKGTVTDLSAEYGYDSPSSFARAFKSFHGIAPSEVGRSESRVRMFTRFGFSLGVSGGEDFSYSITESDGFKIAGICGSSDPEDTECCEQVWEMFNASPLSANEGLFGGRIFASYQNGKNSVDCCIGAKTDNIPDGAGCVEIPASKWVCFKLNSTEDSYVNAFYDRVLFKWFESSGYKRREDFPNLEIFPYDMSEDGFEWEIRIAIL